MLNPGKYSIKYVGQHAHGTGRTFMIQSDNMIRLVVPLLPHI